MISSEKLKTYSIEEIRKTNPRAYEKWSKQEDLLLLKLSKSGESTDKLCAIFQRGNGAIQSRIHKLELPETRYYSGFIRSNQIISEVSFDWIPVLQNEDEIFFFPNPITSFMKKLYRSPAIYRWNIYKNSQTNEKIIYIGEAKQLVPDRINGYLKPGRSQTTNKRVNKCFQEHIQNGYKVFLEIIRFDEMRLGEKVFRHGDLKNKNLRRFIEIMLITYYEQKNYILLNL